MIIGILITIFLSLILYKDTFNAYFFQDDWFNLKISTVHKLSDFFMFFIPRQDVTFYKPLGMQIPFYLLKTLFGLNPLPFHILAFITHVFNIILVYLISLKISQKKNISLFISFLYGTSAIFYTQLFWPSAYSFLIGPTTFFLSFLFFLQFIDRKKKIFYYLSLIIFSLGIFTNEMVNVFPLVISFYLLMSGLRKFWKYVIPFFFLSFTLIFGRFLLFAPPLEGSYQLVFGKHILTNLEAYILWSLNLPEELKAQLVSFWKLNPLFIQNFPQLTRLIYVSLFISFCAFFLFPLFYIKKTSIIERKKILFGLGWFILGLLPVIFFSKHSFSYFLAIPAAGFYFTVGTLILIIISKAKKIFSIILVAIIILNWLITSFTTIDFNKNVHFAPRRSKISQELVDRAKKNYPNQKQKSIIYVPDSSENKLSLNYQDAFQVILGGSIEIVYGSSPMAPKDTIPTKMVQ